MPVHLKGTVQLLYIYTGNLRTTAHNLQSNAINSTKVLTNRRILVIHTLSHNTCKI